MLKNYGRALRMTQSLKIKWLAALGCLFVCMFGNYLVPVLIAAHTANNLDFGYEEDHENEGYESKEPQNLTLAWS